jgi:16S rRNA (cytosine967-C5)-methyltransferase
VSLSPARRIAFEVLRRVEAEGAYASDVLHVELGANLKTEDAALATELTLGVLRWRRLLDCVLAPHLKKAVDRLDLPVAIALRMGVYQLRFLQRVPARAAVNESVELVKRAKKSSAAALVNAVLRRVTEESKASSARTAACEETSDSATPLEQIAISHSHPTWLVKRWLARFGKRRAAGLLDANNCAPRLSIALHDPARRDEIVESLKRFGLRVEPGALLKNAFAVSGGSVVRTEAFQQGLLSAQDEASQVIPLLLDVRSGDRVLDLCAAPGGKTPPLARAAGQAGLVIAADRHAHRLRAMRAQFERLHLAEIQIVELDAERQLPFRGNFDRILVDAPCSGTGTLARHPEIRWRLRPEQLGELHRLQVTILASALDALAPGGRLVYSTCSLEPEENESVIAEVLRQRRASSQLPTGHHFSLVDAAKSADILAPQLAQGVEPASLFDSSGFFRTVPGEHPTDGFFAAILEKDSCAP